MSTGTIGGVGPPGAVDSGAAAVSPARRWRRWLAIAALAVGLVLVATVITGLELGARYQPVGFGNSGGHLAGHMVTRQVDNFAPMTGQTYLPPQRPASGGLYVSLTNNGPRYGPGDVLAAGRLRQRAGYQARRPGAAAGPGHRGAAAGNDRWLLDAGARLRCAFHVLGEGQVLALDSPGPDLVDQPVRSV